MFTRETRGRHVCLLAGVFPLRVRVDVDRDFSSDGARSECRVIRGCMEVRKVQDRFKVDGRGEVSTEFRLRLYTRGVASPACSN